MGIDHHEETIRAQLARLHALRKTSGQFIRPCIVEFTGTPEAGKTSLTLTLTRLFRRNGWRVLNPPEGAESTRRVPRSTPLYNIRTASYILNILLEEAVFSRDWDIIFLDRGPYDAYCWMERWFKENQLSEEQTRINQSFFVQPLLRNLIDVVLFMTCDAREALMREDKWALTDRPGDTTNEASIHKLQRIWQECAARLITEKYPVHHIDTTPLPPRTSGETILPLIVNAIEDRLKSLKIVRQG